MKFLTPLALAAAALLFTACSKNDHAGHSHGGHVHTAPHGGTLVEIGEHAYNVELVRDTAAGKLTAYILDGHASDFIRIAAPSIELVAISGGQRRPLSLKAMANAATGETVGNTSQFEAQADWLKSGGEMAGSIDALEIKGTKFSNIGIHLAK
ncbi:MAG: hypothetical protein V4773_04090 [Verrucomicrobiota bacterium]